MADLTAHRRLLIFGGSFDPPHRAHVDLPEQVRQAIEADVVVYLPAGRAPHKLDKVQTDPAHRLAMLRLALADAVAAGTAVVLDDEIRRVAADGRPSYTVDTLEALKQRIAPGAEMRLLIGTDQVNIFETWKDWQRILQLAEPVVMVRPPETVDDVPEAWRPRVVEVPAMDVSSTEVRRRVAAGQTLGDMVVADVANYIGTHGLYRPDETSARPTSFGEAWFRFTHGGAEPTAADRAALVNGRKVLLGLGILVGVPVFLCLSLVFWGLVAWCF